ncbi:2-C-methyl-D-erythritol 4-phosphate cytidylyltransferase [Alkalibacterium sp. f15]|uniref:2-C-methyl-D-erythritol 4-phosphate cytidylyltransferase n=1 Tax=Alkalibacterium sp. f15 TaxID=3414029 RepID=UPI003BF909FA
MDDQYEAILLAAGSAKRFEHPAQLNKLLMPLNQRPVFDYSLKLLLDDEKCLKIWFVINTENEATIKETVKELYKEVPGKINWVLGGRERQDSVSRALSKMSSSKNKKVLVHDAARPFVTSELLDKLIDKGKGSVAATLAIPAKDSIKLVKDSHVYQSLYRPEVWHIQTPQLFDCQVLTEAIKTAEKDGFYGNEEAELVERLGYPVEIVEGSDYNFKLTTAFDYRVAKMLKENK